MKACDVIAWWRQRPDLLVGIGMSVVCLSLMSPYLFRADVLVWTRSGLGTDVLNYRWAHVYGLRQSLQQYNQIPLWRGSTMGGEPMIGNPSVMLFYPPQLLVALLPIPIMPSFALLTACHLWLAGMGSYVLMRQAVGVRRLPALVAALAMMLTPRLSSNVVGDIGLGYAMCWVPFCLAWARLALDRRRLSWAILAAMGLAFQFLIHVHIFFYTAWAIGLYYLYQVVADVIATRSRPGLWRAMGRRWLLQCGLLALTALACAGLVAFELLPFATYLPHTSRESMTLAEANRYALPLTTFLTSLMPSPLKFPEWELYIGLMPILLAPLAVRHKNRRELAFWIGLALFAVLFSLGSATPLFSFLFYYVPGFRWLRVPARMWFLSTVATTTLSGLAADALADLAGGESDLRRQWGQRWQNWLLFAGWILGLGTIASRWITRQAGELDWLLGFVGALGLASGIGGLLMWVKGRIQYTTLGALLIGALLLDLLPVDVAYMMPMPVARAFEMPDIGRYLLERARAGEPFRTYAVRGEIPYHIAAKEGLEVADGLNSFQFAPYVNLIKTASGCALPGFAASVPPCLTNEVSATAYREATPDAALLGLLNVRYVVTPLPLEGPEWVLLDAAQGERLYENLRVLPRAFAVGHVQAIEDGPDLWQRLSQIDVSTTALVGADETRHPRQALPQSPFHVPARWITHRPNEIVVELDMPGDGLLVLSEVWTPGWRAADNGEPTGVIRVDGGLRGVYLDAGVHRVTLRFLPRTLIWGLGISALTTLACLSAWVWDRHSR
jgi:hypothetical protein